MNENVMKLEENILWISILVLLLLGKTIDSSYFTILFFWIVIVLFIGNVKRVYSKQFPNIADLIRRSMYIVPYFFPLIVGEKMPFEGKHVFICSIIGVLFAIILLIPNLTYWRIVLCDDMLGKLKKRRTFNYFTAIIMYSGSAIAEEFFFRYFILSITGCSNLVLSMLTSVMLFVLNHFTTKWSKAFGLKDYIIQIVFSIGSIVLFLYSRSIIPSAIAHVVYNLPSVLLQYKSYMYYRKMLNTEHNNSVS